MKRFALPVFWLLFGITVILNHHGTMLILGWILTLLWALIIGIELTKLARRRRG